MSSSLPILYPHQFCCRTKLTLSSTSWGVRPALSCLGGAGKREVMGVMAVQHNPHGPVHVKSRYFTRFLVLVHICTAKRCHYAEDVCFEEEEKDGKDYVCGPVVKINTAVLLSGRGEVFQLIIFATKRCITHRATFNTTAAEAKHSL